MSERHAAPTTEQSFADFINEHPELDDLHEPEAPNLVPFGMGKMAVSIRYEEIRAGKRDTGTDIPGGKRDTCPDE